MMFLHVMPMHCGCVEISMLPVGNPSAGGLSVTLNRGDLQQFVSDLLSAQQQALADTAYQQNFSFQAPR